jgi:hypothetical protein
MPLAMSWPEAFALTAVVYLVVVLVGVGLFLRRCAKDEALERESQRAKWGTRR